MRKVGCCRHETMRDGTVLGLLGLRGMIPIPCAGAGTYGGTMAHRRRSVIRFLLTAIALARTGTPVRC